MQSFPCEDNGENHKRSYSKESIANADGSRREKSLSPRRDSDENCKNNEDYDFEDELDPKTMDFERLVDLLHPKFVCDCLERILNFFKGCNSELCFPNIAPYKESFLIKLCTDRNNLSCESFDKTSSEICKDIIKVLDANRNLYKWVHSFESGMISKNVLVYKKDYYRKRKPLQDVGLRSQTPDITNDANDKEIKHYKSLISGLTVPFIMTTLQSMLDFLEDDSSTVIEYPKVTVYQAKFMKALKKIPLNESLYSLLPPESITVVKHIRSELEFGVNLRITEKRSRGRDRTGIITIKKQTKGRGKNSSSRKRNDSGDYNTRDTRAASTSDSEYSDVDREDRHKQNGHNSSTENDKLRNINSRYNSKGIKWQPAGRTSDRKGDSDKFEKGRKPNRSKLAQALKQPVKIDVADRMMRLMGWNGGALGLRGEGITEPIMPAIDLVSGAGFGHSPKGRKKERKKETRHSRTSAYFRIDLLENILDLLLKDSDTKIIDYADPIRKKERLFIHLCVSAFNARKNCGLNLDEEKELVSKIMKNLYETRIGIDVVISDDFRMLTLRKTKDLKSYSSRRNRKKNSDSRDERAKSEPIESESEISETQRIRDYQIDDLVDKLTGKNKRASRKSIIGLAYRIMFLKSILRFVKSDNDIEKVVFDDMLSNRNRNFIENCIKTINSREKTNYSSRIENDLYSDIQRKVNTKLKVSFTSSARKYILQRCHKKRNRSPSPNNNETSNSTRHKFRNYDRNSDSEDSMISLECDSDMLCDDNDRRKDKYSYNKDNDDRKDTDKEGSRKDNDNKRDIDIKEAKDINNKAIAMNILNEFEKEDRGVDIDSFVIEEMSVIDEIDSIPSIKNDFSPEKVNFEKELSENPSSVSSKRSRTESEDSDIRKSKRIKVNEKDTILAIVYKEKDKIMSFNVVETIQKELSSKLDNDNLVRLKCFGVINNGLHYKVFNENSEKWLTSVFEDSEFKVIASSNDIVKNNIKIAAKTYHLGDYKEFLRRLKCYNSDLSVDNWILLEERIGDDFVSFQIEVDFDSYEYLKEKRFSLHTGLDFVDFCELWS